MLCAISTNNYDGFNVHPSHRRPPTHIYVLAETQVGPHVTCEKKPQKSGLRFVSQQKTATTNRRGKQVDSILAICILLDKTSCKDKRKLKMVYKLGAYLCIPSTSDVAAASARVDYAPDRTQSKPNNKLPSETTTAAAVYTAP